MHERRLIRRGKLKSAVSLQFRAWDRGMIGLGRYQLHPMDRDISGSENPSNMRCRMRASWHTTITQIGSETPIESHWKSAEPVSFALSYSAEPMRIVPRCVHVV